MDLSLAAAHFGLSARATATRHGIDWAPRIGPTPYSVLLPDADFAFSTLITFPEATGFASYTPGGESIILSSAADVVEVSGITGTDAASLNGNYTRSAILYNGGPQWINGTATLRLIAAGIWECALAGTPHFYSSVPSPTPVGVQWEDAGAAGSAGAASMEVIVFTEGDSPIISAAADFEGAILPALDRLVAVQVDCSVGSALLAFGNNITCLPLSTGASFAFALPLAGPTGIPGGGITLHASESGTILQFTVLGVTTP